MTLTKHQVTEYRQLKDSGVDVEDSNQICYNSGSETSLHITAKSLAGLIGIQNGYRVDSEVPIETRLGENETDVLLWGHEARLTYSIEADHALTPEKKRRKKEKYVDYTAIDDIQFLDLNSCPQDITEAFGWIASELGLDPN